MARRKNTHKQAPESDFFKLVHASFTEYEEFRTEKKRSAAEVLELAYTPPRRAYIGCAELTPATGLSGYLQGEISDRPLLKYQLKLFAATFGQAPCLRFCSRGSTHINKETGTGLQSGPVETPHFHKVEADGWMRAYHGHHLNTARKRSNVRKSVVLGAKRFCQEFNIESPRGGFVTLKHFAEALPLSAEGAMDSAAFP